MELDYTRQSSMASFTKSRTIFLVFEWTVEIRSNGEKSQKKEPTLCLNQNRKGWATLEHFTYSAFDDSDRVRRRTWVNVAKNVPGETTSLSRFPSDFAGLTRGGGRRTL